MLKLLEKTFLFGLGSVAITKNKAEAFVKDAMDEAKLSPEEGDQLLGTILAEGKAFKQKLHDSVTEVISTRGQSLLPNYQSITCLEKKIEELEQRLAKLEPEVTAEEEVEEEAKAEALTEA